jgi:hypothetical protein
MTLVPSTQCKPPEMETSIDMVSFQFRHFTFSLTWHQGCVRFDSFKHLTSRDGLKPKQASGFIQHKYRFPSSAVGVAAVL